MKVLKKDLEKIVKKETITIEDLEIFLKGKSKDAFTSLAFRNQLPLNDEIIRGFIKKYPDSYGHLRRKHGDKFSKEILEEILPTLNKAQRGLWAKVKNFPEEFIDDLKDDCSFWSSRFVTYTDAKELLKDSKKFNNTYSGLDNNAMVCRIQELANNRFLDKETLDLVFETIMETTTPTMIKYKDALSRLLSNPNIGIIEDKIVPNSHIISIHAPFSMLNANINNDTFKSAAVKGILKTFMFKDTFIKFIDAGYKLPPKAARTLYLGLVDKSTQSTNKSLESLIEKVVKTQPVDIKIKERYYNKTGDETFLPEEVRSIFIF